MDKKELPFLTASQLSRLIETKEVSPVEATEAYLDRIEAVDPKLNSYITVTGEQALRRPGRRRTKSPPASTGGRYTACPWR